MREGKLKTEVGQMGTLVMIGILLWAFVLRPNAKKGQGAEQPSEGEFKDLQITAVPSGVEQSPQRLVAAGDTIGISGGTVQYKGPAKTCRLRFYLYRGTATTSMATNYANFAVPESMTWRTVSLPRVTLSVSSAWDAAVYQGDAVITEAVSPYTEKLRSARSSVYEIRVPAAALTALSVSWI